MSLRRAFALFWWAGLIAFALVIFLSIQVTPDTRMPGIGDHQVAGTGARVNAIHASWADAGTLNLAKAAMLAGLVFIGLFGAGCMLGGWYYWRTGQTVVAALGLAALIAGAVFLVTDYVETIAQIVQLLRDRGGDRYAALAAAMQQPKVASFLVAFFGIALAFAIRRVLGRAA